MPRWPKKTWQERFWEKVDKNGPTPNIPGWALGPCWLWTAGKSDDYGVFWRRGKRWEKAHRIAFELIYGRALDPKKQPHHRCFNEGCVNPFHLQEVTPKEHVHLGDTVAKRNAAVTHCPKGHPYTPANTRYQFRASRGGLGAVGTYIRKCRTCHREWERTRRKVTAA